MFHPIFTPILDVEINISPTSIIRKFLPLSKSVAFFQDRNYLIQQLSKLAFFFSNPYASSVSVLRGPISLRIDCEQVIAIVSCFMYTVQKEVLEMQRRDFFFASRLFLKGIQF